MGYHEGFTRFDYDLKSEKINITIGGGRGQTCANVVYVIHHNTYSNEEHSISLSGRVDYLNKVLSTLHYFPQVDFHGK